MVFKDQADSIIGRSYGPAGRDSYSARFIRRVLDACPEQEVKPSVLRLGADGAN